MARTIMTRTGYCGVVSIVVCVITAISPARAVAGADPSRTIELYKQERVRAATVTVEDVERFVSLVHWTLEDGWEARVVVQAAGNSGKREFRPVLKRAAETWSKAGAKSLTFCALHNLWKLGEPPEYFLENVRGHKENPELAMYSALVWGRDATEESLFELARIKDETSLDSPIRNWAYPLVRGAVHCYKQYASLKSVEEKVDMILGRAGGGWSPLGGQASDALSVQYPEIYWARRELLSLCKQDPELVARRVLAKDLSELKGSVRYDSLWEYLAQFLDEKAAAAYRRLKPTWAEAAKRAAEDE